MADRRRLPDRERAAALDQHRVRTWTSWHRWTTLALLAHAFLSVIAATDHHHQQEGLIPLTRNEIRRLFSQLLDRDKRALVAIAAWSRWRRRHHARTMACHYRRRQLT